MAPLERGHIDSNLSMLCQLQSILCVHTKISDRILNLGMSEQDLDCVKVACRFFRSSLPSFARASECHTLHVAGQSQSQVSGFLRQMTAKMTIIPKKRSSIQPDRWPPTHSMYLGHMAGYLDRRIRRARRTT